MKKIKLLTALALSAVVLLQLMPSSVSANEVSQEQDQKLKVKCTTGSYGQTSTCTAEGEQHQKQKVVYVDKMPVHEVVNTALDANSMLVIAALFTLATGAYVLKRKLA